MRESMSMSTIFGFVILFVLLFAGIMALTINNSNAFGVKNEILSIIEENDGNYMDGSSLSSEIVTAIEEMSYRTTGTCDKGYTGFDRSGKNLGSNQPSGAAICIKAVNITSGLSDYYSSLGLKTASNASINGTYYRIEVFYSLDIPVVNSLMNFKIKGETRIIYG